ncbi:hypothetical protein SAMN04487939_12238 [Lysobacter sp. yr284]|nr:hypothetical protein SAMN04487939_12238 [Lysobacter sp. yr284]
MKAEKEAFMSVPQRRGEQEKDMHRVPGREFSQARQPIAWAEFYLHDLLRQEEDATLADEDRAAVFEVVRSAWAITKMLCDQANVDLPREPDWETILREYVYR